MSDKPTTTDNIVPLPVDGQVRWGDSFVNMLAGLGVVGRDKFASQTYTHVPLNTVDLENAYRSDWIARKVVTIPAWDMTREWRAWQADPDQIELLETLEKKLFIQQKLQTALIKARLYGGAAVIIGVDAGTPEEELDLEQVAQDSLKFIHVVSKNQLRAGPIIRDISSKYFGQPEFYEARQEPISKTFEQAEAEKNPEYGKQNVKLHPSRVVKLIGMDTADQMLSDIWGDSVLQAVNDSVKMCGLVTGSLATLVAELKVDVIKIPELKSILATKQGENKMIARFQAANVAKSVINTIMIDGNEEWQRIQASLTGVPEVIMAYMQTAAGAADIPATRFLGMSPAGLNATGESDIRNYYDRLAAEQETVLTPAMTTLDDVLIRSALGDRPPEVWYEWRSLWQLSDTEKAELALKKAQSYQIDVNAAQLPPTALANARANQLIEDGVYPGLEKALEDAALEGDTIESQSATPVMDPMMEAQKTLAEGGIVKPPGQPGGPPGGPPKGGGFPGGGGGVNIPGAPPGLKVVVGGKDSFEDINECHEPAGTGKGGQFCSADTAAIAAFRPPNGDPARPWQNEDNGNAKAGDEILVFRLGSKEGGLAGKNAGNVNAVANHLANIDDFEKPAFAGGSGDTISAYRVKLLDDPGGYAAVAGGRPAYGGTAKPSDLGGVGRTVKRGANDYAETAYSFPSSGLGYEHSKLDSVPLSEVRSQLSSMGYSSADDAGTLKTSQAIRTVFNRRIERDRRYDSVADFNQCHEPGGSGKGGQFCSAPGLEGYSPEAKLDSAGVIHTPNVEDAARALFENRKVSLDQPKKVSTLLDKLAQMVKDAEKKGEKAPLLNLCNVSVKGTNLFCTESKGVPRVKMPQLNAEREGMLLDRDREWTALFLDHLKKEGVRVEDGREYAANLRATQSEMNAAKVADIANSGEPLDRLVVSKDDYILDGHHRWAAQVVRDARDGTLNNGLKMDVTRVNMGITELLQRADDFSLPRQAFGQGSGGRFDSEPDLFDYNRKHKPKGSSEGGQFATSEEGGSEGGGGEEPKKKESKEERAARRAEEKAAKTREAKGKRLGKKIAGKVVRGAKKVGKAAVGVAAAKGAHKAAKAVGRALRKGRGEGLGREGVGGLGAKLGASAALAAKAAAEKKAAAAAAKQAKGKGGAGGKGGGKGGKAQKEKPQKSSSKSEPSKPEKQGKEKKPEKTKVSTEKPGGEGAKTGGNQPKESKTGANQPKESTKGKAPGTGSEGAEAAATQTLNLTPAEYRHILTLPAAEQAAYIEQLRKQRQQGDSVSRETPAARRIRRRRRLADARKRRRLADAARKTKPCHAPKGSKNPRAGTFVPCASSAESEDPSGKLPEKPTAELLKPEDTTLDEVIKKVPGGQEFYDYAKKNLENSVDTDKLVSEGGHKNPDGSWTDDRKKVHDALLDKLFSPEAVAAATPKPGEKPLLDILGGRGGSGKSWFTNPEKGGTVDKDKAMYINSDDFKEALPGYNGWNAANLHEESSHLASRAEKMARDNGLNTIIDGTMRSANSLNDRVDSFRNAGYETNGHYMYTSPAKAAERALKRGVDGEAAYRAGTSSTGGRFVDPEYTYSSRTNETSFDSVKGRLDNWEVYDNNGSHPVFYSRKHR